MMLKGPYRKRSRLPKEPEEKQFNEYRDKRQVDLDISRVSISKAASANLAKRIGLVLSANPELHYYQGFHDVAMHTHNQTQLENLALQQLRDFMAPSLQPTMQMLGLVPELLALASPDGIGSYFNGVPADSRRLYGYFALAPIVTLFSHECTDTAVIGPIIRAVMREGIAYAIYLYAALVIVHGPVLEKNLNEGSVFNEDDEFEMALQGVGAKMTAETYPELDRLARRLRSKFPLRRLRSYQQISKYSVLKVGKITKKSTATYMLKQLDRDTKSSSTLQSKAALLFAVSAIAFGMVWSRMHR